MGIYEDRPLIEQDKKDNPEDYLFGVHKMEVVGICQRYTEKHGFPGTKKYEPNNPIWDCSVAGKKTPKEAWNDFNCLFEAIDNLYWITNKSIITNKYPDFVDRIFNAFYLAQPFDFEGPTLESDKINVLPLCREVLLRFTIAKIAPKVTALQPSAFERIIEESGVDISSGIFCPMAGFGGIIEGAKHYYKKKKMNAEVEAYDINPYFCKYYGWKKRDVLAQVVKTDKIVFVCPPFGDKTERWKGTPDIRNDEYKTNYLDFHDWCKLIKEHVIAPNYIFVGPELRSVSKYKSGITPSGLFRKKFGIQYYPEYSI